jgi:hypothetical protein
MKSLTVIKPFEAKHRISLLAILVNLLGLKRKAALSRANHPDCGHINFGQLQPRRNAAHTLMTGIKLCMKRRGGGLYGDKISVRIP